MYLNVLQCYVSLGSDKEVKTVLACGDERWQASGHLPSVTVVRACSRSPYTRTDLQKQMIKWLYTHIYIYMNYFSQCTCSSLVFGAFKPFNGMNAHPVFTYMLHV